MQSGTNYTVDIARETTEGVAALVGATAYRLRSSPSPGLELKRNRINSNIRRADMTKEMPRLGYKTVDGSYNFDFTIGGVLDLMAEAIMRSVWSASTALTTATGAGECVDLTPDTTSTITRTGTGSFITDGWKKGDIARMTLYTPVAGNNNINLRVKTVTANILTFYGTPLTVGAADTDAVLTRLKKVITAASPTDYSHTVAQYEVNNDRAKLFLGCHAVRLRISVKPGEMATFSVDFLGMDRTLLETGQSPWFSGPTTTTGVGLIADESLLAVNGASAGLVVGFDLEFVITASGKAVLGSFVTPGIFTNDLEVSGSLMFIRSDFTNDTLFDAETEFETNLILVEPGVAPVGTFGIHLPRCKYTGQTAQLGEDGPMIETVPFVCAVAVATSTQEATIASISSSAA